jgi:hypothetical protein
MINSLIFGSGGEYNFYIFSAKFEHKPGYCDYQNSLKASGFASTVAKKLLNNNVLRLTSLGYTHVFVHEMSHAIAIKFFSGISPKITVYTSSCSGKCEYPRDFPPWKASIINAAGPLGDIAFSIGKLLLMQVFKTVLPYPLILLVAGGAIAWVLGELLYAYISVNTNYGDFGEIAKTGPLPLTIATTLLLTESFYALFLAKSLL